MERKLHRDGASTYKIKDATGMSPVNSLLHLGLYFVRLGKKTVNTTVHELTLMLEQFNIQVNNPCAILMQETSKQFLCTAKPQDKYQV